MGFYPISKKQKYRPKCRDCEKIVNPNALLNKARLAKAQFIFEIKQESKCEICEESDHRCLQFDHKDPTQKKIDISQAAKSSMTLEQIREEIDKCRVLCANCHAKHTAEQFGFYKGLKTNDN